MVVGTKMPTKSKSNKNGQHPGLGPALLYAALLFARLIDIYAVVSTLGAVVLIGRTI
jgi:hypothetical protein